MILTERISQGTTNFIGKYRDLSEVELQKVKYGIDILVLNTYKLVIVLLLSHLLGIFFQTLLFMLSFTFIRLFAFGIHARKGLSCLIATSAIFLGLTYFSPFVSLTSTQLILLLAINIVAAMLFAPADTEKRPIINPKKRQLLKIKTIFALILLYVIAIFYCDSSNATIIALGSTVACIIINPIVYILSGQQYDNYRYYKKKDTL